MDTTRRLVPAILLLSFTPALGALAPTTVSVPVAGTVFGLPESVFFSGTALITVRPAEATNIATTAVSLRLVFRVVSRLSSSETTSAVQPQPEPA